MTENNTRRGALDGMSNVIPLFGPSPPEDRSWETPRQRAGRKLNPLRHPYQQIELAILVAGKLLRGEPQRVENHIECLRRGAGAARLLADELAFLVEQEVRS